ncbi:Membrane-fusion protein [Ignavibacterium album JCM 16511]|uniref:Membrane-fusion protein n=1 Tax=Ignavibacterium album (strain DSM 19864 / JCM 16511 / NBRC 101810 / Mat9-16) TaxID=945713 RepID=I0AHE9_IGNAJ|nr:efflux RND transporter periplasmic adaptor subunit [Ignavibacterium album]AFH48406.1 Membrane-fusion protein [Ignavibacterium album JCM 16511]
MRISPKVIFIVIGLISILIISLILRPNEEHKQKEDPTTVNYEKLDDIVFDVRVKEVFKGDLVKSISANGLVKAYRELDVVSNITNYIDRIFISEGQFVNRGDLLIKFDDNEQKIALSEAEVTLLNAKIEYGFLTKEEARSVDIKAADSIKSELLKLENFFNENKITEEEYLKLKEKLDLALIFTGAKRDEILLNKSGLTNAINSMNRAKLNLSYTEIKAPFSGVIADLNLVPRQRISSGEKLFKLLDISKLQIDVGILENEINQVNIGNKAIIKLNAIPGKVYLGKVININPKIDPETKTCRVTVEITNNDNKIKPGMFATLQIETEILKNRVLIPNDALLVRDKRNLVFLVDDNLAKWQYVMIGEHNEQYTEILEGVSPGHFVIIEGHYNLAHDSKIRIIED